MDALSRLLSLYPLRTTLDIRCHFGAPWIFEEPEVAQGIAPYHLVVRGAAFLDSGEQKRVALQEGDIIMFPKGAGHRIYTDDSELASPAFVMTENQVVRMNGNDGEGPVTELLCGRFEFNADQNNALLEALPPFMLIRCAGRDEFSGLRTLMALLEVETDMMRPGTVAVVSQLSSALFALLIRAWLEQAHSMPGLFALLAEPRLQAVMLGILSAPEKNWSLEDMATTSHMSRATFVRLFNHTSGTTPATLLMTTRMAQAAAWLSEGRRAVADIGQAVGYQSEAAFNRVFKRYFGVGPGQFRRTLRKDG